MADIFIEHLVTREKTITTRLIGVLYIVALVTVVLITFMFEILFMLFPVALVGGIWLVIRLIKGLDIEFEYIVTNGEVDIDRISGKRKRKRLLTVDCRNFEILAPDNPGYFAAYERFEFKEKVDVSSGANPRWFAICPSKQGGKLLLYFEPNDRMLDAFRLYNQRAVKQ